ncbi:uncharacterized protein LOC5580145 [Aedes aegypti]|uniref:Uncharacterized protein n=1 Tax=Aedes aegypti TaxID=7159 RepID=A0A1S4F1R2_AEDAE|nr:uncharacterized protein LOC5580145 [Aedes aegypti]
MRQELVLILFLFYGASSSTIDHTVPDSDKDLTTDEASQVAQSLVDAGLNGFKMLRVRYSKVDVDSCNMILTSIFEVQLRSTGEVFEISSDSNVTDAVNCKSKRKLLEAIKIGGFTRVQHMTKVKDDQTELKDISIDQFRADKKMLEQKDFRIVASNYSYQFAGDEGVVSDAELIELHVRMVDTGNEYLVNIVGEIEMFGPVISRANVNYPPKVLLSLLGGGSYSKMKRKKYSS